MTKPAPSGTRPRQFSAAFICLLAVVLLLFWRSFTPELALFSNDGPLGAISAQADYAWQNLTGVWQPLNWIGSSQPGGFLTFDYILYALLGPLFTAKFLVPFAHLALGLAAWFLFRQAGFHQGVCVVAALAAMLNSNAVSSSCWGLANWTLLRAWVLLALAALITPHIRCSIIKTALAGFAVGMGVMHGFDLGAIMSLYVAAFALFYFATREPGRLWSAPAWLRSAGRVVLMGAFALFIAAQAVSVLIGTQIKGVVGTEQDEQTKEQRWDFATQWSLPKLEIIRVAMPGIFGYRMDTPEGGQYWGEVGQQPGWPQTPGLARHSGSGEYAGLFVVLIAFWAMAQAARGDKSIFNLDQRRMIWFWAAAALISVLLAFGRHAPLYQVIYAFPYFSTIRNPIKFMHPFHVSIGILFAYGLQGMARSYLSGGPEATPAKSPVQQLKSWWAQVRGFDRRWFVVCGLILAASALAWMIYDTSSRSLERHLTEVAFSPDEAKRIAAFSIWEMGRYVLALAIAIAIFAFIASGWFRGARTRWAWLLAGAFVVADLAQANLPWIIYYDYKEKYESNPVIKFLEEEPWEHRVAAKLLPFSGQYLVGSPEASQLFIPVHNEWLQQLFQYYRIQSLDIVQMPRMPALDHAYATAFIPTSTNEYFRISRLWQLTNTRYLLGERAFLPILNHQFDSGQGRFTVKFAFDIVPKHPITEETALSPESFTATIHDNGHFALFEFTAALPRARLYQNWQVITNDSLALQSIVSRSFDPEQRVLINDSPAIPSPPPDGASPGSATIIDFSPKEVRVKATASAPSILLLNDRYDPFWEVRVNGEPQPLLRCNFIMRGVLLEQGENDVVFRYQPPTSGLYVTIAGIVAGLSLLGLVIASPKVRAKGGSGSESPAQS